MQTNDQLTSWVRVEWALSCEPAASLLKQLFVFSDFTSLHRIILLYFVLAVFPNDHVQWVPSHTRWCPVTSSSIWAIAALLHYDKHDCIAYVMYSSISKLYLVIPWEYPRMYVNVFLQSSLLNLIVFLLCSDYESYPTDIPVNHLLCWHESYFLTTTIHPQQPAAHLSPLGFLSDRSTSLSVRREDECCHHD